jgi:hypothetical protein
MRHGVAMDLGIIGGVVGGALGIAGGVVGTYFSIKNTAGPRERAFMVRTAIIGWLAISAFLLGLFLFPHPYSMLLWAPYVVALIWAIRWCNRRQQQIRAAERTSGSAVG